MKSTELTNEITPYMISIEPDQAIFGVRKNAAWSGPRGVVRTTPRFFSK